LAAAAQPTTPTASAATPGSGFVDPSRLPPRPPAQDVAPIFRAPAVDTLATLRQRGTLRVGVVPVSPMVMRDAKGELVGYSVDLARRMAQDLGVDVEFVPTTWADIVPGLLGRHYDLIATGFWATVQRALVVNFSDATATEGIYLVANRSLIGRKSTLADFDRADVRIAVYAGTPQEALAKRRFPHAKLLRIDDDHMEPVLQGRADAVLVPTLSPQAVLASAPGKLVLVQSQPLASTPAALAVRKGDPDFLNFLNTWLMLRRGEGWLDERAAHWSSRGGAELTN
jgi:polar amino acid transport system substrate-binding protein